MWFQIYLKDAAAPEMKVIFSNYRSALETALDNSTSSTTRRAKDVKAPGCGHP